LSVTGAVSSLATAIPPCFLSLFSLASRLVTALIAETWLILLLSARLCLP
jgi:hypothetical protein